MSEYLKYITILLIVMAIGQVKMNAMPESIINDNTNVAISYDSVLLKSMSIYVCKGHFFEWSDEPILCPHCEEPLEKITLWEYLKLLECEECKAFFDEHYNEFVKAQSPD